MNMKDTRDMEYNHSLLKVVHDQDEEPKGVPAGVDIQVSHASRTAKKYYVILNINFLKVELHLPLLKLSTELTQF